MATRPETNSASSFRCALGGWLTLYLFCRSRLHRTASSACTVLSCTPFIALLKKRLPLAASSAVVHSRKPRSGTLNPATLGLPPTCLVRATASLVKSSHVLTLSGQA